MIEPLNVFVSAYACEPGKGSEPGNGWNIVRGLSRLHRLTVLTRENNRKAIEASLDTEGIAAEFIYFDLPPWMLQLKKRRLLSVSLYYLFWQVGAYHRFRTAVAEGQYDIIHHLTFNSFETPGFFWLMNCPFVLGPIGGGQTTRLSLLAEFGPRAALELLRNIRVRLSHRNPIVRQALRKASAVLYANKETAQLLDSISPTKSQIMVDVGVDTDAFAIGKTKRGSDFTILYVGRLERRKGIALLYKVLRDLCILDGFRGKIVGGGPMRRWVERRIAADNLTGRIDLEPPCTHAEVKVIFQNADVFVFPSLRDTSGSVVLEAMASGLPIVTLDHQGVAVMTTSRCAIRIQAGPCAVVVGQIRDAIRQLHLDRELRERMGLSGRRRAELLFAWKAKVNRISKIYHEVSLKRESSDTDPCS